MHELHGYRVQLRCANSTGGRLAAQGCLEKQITCEERVYFEALHGDAPIGRLRAEVIAWHRTPDEQHAFTPDEWKVECRWTDSNELADHLNDHHPDFLNALAPKPLRGSVHAVSVDPDGLLLECGDRLSHVPFPGLARNPAEAASGIFMLARSLESRLGRMQRDSALDAA